MTTASVADEWGTIESQHADEVKRAPETRQGRCIVHGKWLDTTIIHAEDTWADLPARADTLKRVKVIITVRCQVCSHDVSHCERFDVDAHLDTDAVIVAQKQRAQVRAAYWHNLYALQDWAYFVEAQRRFAEYQREQFTLRISSVD